jgi:hypothetical protein
VPQGGIVTAVRHQVTDDHFTLFSHFGLQFLC